MRNTLLPHPISGFAASILIAVICLLMSGPVAAQNVLTPDTESLYRCTHTWTDADGNMFGFRLSECGLDLYDFKANPDKASIDIIVPDILLLDGEELRVTTISSVFYNCKALVTLTLPSTVFYILYGIQGVHEPYRHLLSDAPTTLRD